MDYNRVIIDLYADDTLIYIEGDSDKQCHKSFDKDKKR